MISSKFVQALTSAKGRDRPVVTVQEFVRSATCYADSTGSNRPRADFVAATLYSSKTEDDMVYLALTPQGLRDILDASEAAKTPIWCSANALSEAEFEKLERGNVTRFTYSFVNADKAKIQGALATIEDHHPGERVWIESVVFET